MATVKEKMPAFTEKEYQPAKLRQLVAIIERRLDSMEREIASGGSGATTTIIDREMAFFLGR